MGTGRLEAFSDGVIAIILTIMVLEIKVPHGGDIAALAPVVPILLSYVMSFVYIGIYWNNHHHMLHASKQVNGWVLWANLHLLFWLSLIPVATGWLGENGSAAAPSSAYSVLLFMAAISFILLERTLIAAEGRGSKLARAVGTDRKGLLSLVLYAAGVGLAFVRPWIAQLLYATVAIVWVVPDPRIEKTLGVKPR